MNTGLRLSARFRGEPGGGSVMERHRVQRFTANGRCGQMPPTIAEGRAALANDLSTAMVPYGTGGLPVGQPPVRQLAGGFMR